MESPRQTLSAWMPALGTMVLFLIVISATAMLASNMLADLVGLSYLLASPVIYRVLDVRTGPTGESGDG